MPEKVKTGFFDQLFCGMMSKSEEEYRKQLSNGYKQVLSIEYADDHFIVEDLDNPMINAIGHATPT